MSNSIAVEQEAETDEASSARGGFLMRFDVLAGLRRAALDMLLPPLCLGCQTRIMDPLSDLGFLQVQIVACPLGCIIETAANKAGHDKGRRTFRRVADSIGVDSRRSPVDGGAEWRLPPRN